MVHLDESTHLYEKILDLAPQAVDKIQQMFENKKSNNNGGNNTPTINRKQVEEHIEYNGPKTRYDL